MFCEGSRRPRKFWDDRSSRPSNSGWITYGGSQSGYSSGGWGQDSYRAPMPDTSFLAARPSRRHGPSRRKVYYDLSRHDYRSPNETGMQFNRDGSVTYPPKTTAALWIGVEDSLSKDGLAYVDLGKVVFAATTTLKSVGSTTNWKNGTRVVDYKLAPSSSDSTLTEADLMRNFLTTMEDQLKAEGIKPAMVKAVIISRSEPGYKKVSKGAERVVAPISR